MDAAVAAVLGRSARRPVAESFGPWQTAYERLTRWSADGTWAKLLARAQADADAAGELDRLIAADSTLVGGTSTEPAPGGWAATPQPGAKTPTTRTAAGAPNEGDSSAEVVVAEPTDHAVGRSRGGLTTKVHALTDGRGRAPVVLLTAGNVHDTTVFAPLLAALRVARSGPGRPRTCPDHLVADRGYSSRANRTLLRRRGSPTPSPSPAISRPTGAARVPPAVRPASTPAAAPVATSSNAASAPVRRL
ncbi:transposase [Geodermatophilus sp. SYSU D00691]